MKELRLRMEPIKSEFFIFGDWRKSPARMDRRRTAIELANYLLENDFIAFHEPIIAPSANGAIECAVFYAYKPSRGLP